MALNRNNPFSLGASLRRIQRQHANWLAQGLDAKPKICLERHQMDPSQLGRFTPRPPGFWLTFCEHSVPLSARCRKCRR